jgi:hypothetical protein
MATKESAERACKEPNPIIDGRKANVNLAILGAKPRGNLTGIFLHLGLPVLWIPGFRIRCLFDPRIRDTRWPK